MAKKSKKKISIAHASEKVEMGESPTTAIRRKRDSSIAVAVNLLKEKKAVYYVDEGDNKGCWVMKLETEADREKIIVRSDGTVTYVGKDIAYQLWKFGLLERDFHYEAFEKEGDKTIWITTATPSEETPSFGSGSLVYNVIDTRQSYLQQIVVQGLKSLHFDKQAEKSIHFSYEMVALSPNLTCPKQP